MRHADNAMRCADITIAAPSAGNRADISPYGRYRRDPESSRDSRGQEALPQHLDRVRRHKVQKSDPSGTSRAPSTKIGQPHSATSHADHGQWVSLALFRFGVAAATRHFAASEFPMGGVDWNTIRTAEALMRSARKRWRTKAARSFNGVSIPKSGSSAPLLSFNARNPWSRSGQPACSTIASEAITTPGPGPGRAQSARISVAERWNTDGCTTLVSTSDTSGKAIRVS